MRPVELGSSIRSSPPGVTGEDSSWCSVILFKGTAPFYTHTHTQDIGRDLHESFVTGRCKVNNKTRSQDLTSIVRILQVLFFG